MMNNTRPWDDGSYRPPLGSSSANSMNRQPSAGGGGFGAPVGQQQDSFVPQPSLGGFGNNPYQPPLHGLGGGQGGLPQPPHQHQQQFMPTQYSAPLQQQSGLTQRTPSATTHHFQPNPNVHAFMPSNMNPTTTVTSSFGGGHEVGVRSNMTPSAFPTGGATTAASTGSSSYRFGYPEDDLPLLEELGIHPSHIRGKAIAVLHPLGKMREEAIQDPDLAGPFVFAVILGFLLSLQGKVQFSAIYGLSSLGMFGFRVLVGLMSDEDVRVLHIVSTLGYCLLPNLILAVIQTVLLWVTGSHKLALPFALVTVMWSAWCACQMFAKLFAMEQQRFLLLYPLAVFYSVFAALTLF